MADGQHDAGGRWLEPVLDHTLDSSGVGQPVSSTNPIPFSSPATLRANDIVAVTATTYSSGNAVGGLRTFANMARASGQGGLLQSVVLRDKAANNVPYEMFLFDAVPGATTVTDKSAVAINSTDLAKVIGVIPITGISLGAATTMGVSVAYPGLAYKLSSGTTISAILVTRGAPTYVTTTDVSVDLISLPD